MDSNVAKFAGIAILALAVLVTGPSMAAGFGFITLTDPALGGMAAGQLAIPAGWGGHGIVAVDSCHVSQAKYPVFRIHSADGKMSAQALQNYGWTWVTGNPGLKAARGCLPLQGPVAPTEFLQLLVQHFLPQVHIVGPVPQSSQSGAQNGKSGALRVTVGSGAARNDGLMSAFVSCSARPATDGSPAGGACYAHATIFFAPSGELDSLLQMVQHVPPFNVSQRWLTAARHTAPHR